MDFEAMQKTLKRLGMEEQDETKRLADDKTLVRKDRIITKANSRLTYDLKFCKKAEEHIKTLPGLDETLHLILPGNYAAFDLTLAVINLLNEKVELLTITTLGYNKSNFTHLMRLIDAAKIEKLQLMASEVFQEKDAPVANYSLTLAENTKRVRIAFNRNHSKIQIFETLKRTFVVETSSNLRSCSCIEQATITQSPELGKFHKTWIEELMNKKAKW